MRRPAYRPVLEEIVRRPVYRGFFLEIWPALRINNPMRRSLRVRRQRSRRASRPARSARVRDRNNAREASNEIRLCWCCGFRAHCRGKSFAGAGASARSFRAGTQPAFDNVLLGCRYVSGALRISVRLRQARPLARSLDFRPITGAGTKRCASTRRPATKARPRVSASNDPVEVPLGHHGNPGEARGVTCPIPLSRSSRVRLAWSAPPWFANADPLPRTRDKSAASGAAVPSDARQLSGNEASALPPSDATPTRDTPPLAPPAVLRKVKLQDTSMSTPQPQPPLRPGDRVRYIYDYDHIEIVESCELTAEAVPHWRVVTTWDGHRRIADAKEFVIEGT